jgi:ornithine cyclodeaminase/alanine dehydrogenase-like protein (mu-crystallin family)
MRLRTVDHDVVHGLVDMNDAIGAVRDAFVDFEHDRFEMPPRVPLGDSQFLFMPTHHRLTGSAVIKALSVNFERVPSITGTVTWVELSHPNSLIIDAEAVTALRTGAAVGVATELMAPVDATRLVMIGAGAQAFYQVIAVNTVRQLTQVTVVDLDQSRAERLVLQLQDAIPNATISVERDVPRALLEAEIVNCATTSRRQLFQAADLAPTVHVNAIGAFKPGMRELPDDLLAQATVVVDDRASAMSEAGEIIDAVAAGSIREEDLVLIGQLLGRPFTRTPRTVFKSVGIAAQDWAIAHLVALRVAERDNKGSTA